MVQGANFWLGYYGLGCKAWALRLKVQGLGIVVMGARFLSAPRRAWSDEQQLPHSEAERQMDHRPQESKVIDY